MKNFINTELAARLEGISQSAIIKRIQRNKYPAWAVRRSARPGGGYQYELCEEALSAKSLEQSELPTTNYQQPTNRKRRADAGNTTADENLILRCAAHIMKIKASSPNKLKRNFGFKEAYDKIFIPASIEKGAKLISYQQFINLTKKFVDKEIQVLNNIGSTKFRQSKTLKLRHDYSIYEPMEFIQNDHTQFDVLCIHDKKIIRPWASFHFSVGDRVLSYPTIVERPDSYSLADDLVNFVNRYGLSRRPVRYYSDNGKAQKSRVMTRANEIVDLDLKPYDLEHNHLQLMNLMSFGYQSEKGLIENLGMVEQHAEARMPHQKIIERHFGIGGTMEWFKDRVEYTGRKYEEKPERLSAVIKSGNIWHSDEMIDYVMGKVDEYNNRTHQGIKNERKGMFAVPHTYDLDIEYFQTNARVLTAFKGVIPASMNDVYRIFNDPGFAKDLGTNIYSPMWVRKLHEICGWVSRALPDRQTLAMLAMKAEERTVHHYGININGGLYINIKLQPYIGKRVAVRYSASNIVRIREESGKEKLFIKEVYVFEKHRTVKNGEERFDERFICIAEPHPFTVKGVVPAGRTKVFLSERNKNYKEITSAAKITTQFAESKKTESAQATNIIQIGFRESAARVMHEAIEEKKIQKQTEALQEEMLLNELSEIYGTNLKKSSEG